MDRLPVSAALVLAGWSLLLGGGSARAADPGAEPVAASAAVPPARGVAGVVAGVPITPVPPASADGAAATGPGGNLALVVPPGTEGGRESGNRVPMPVVATVPRPTAAQESLINTGVASLVVRPGIANIFPVSAGRVNRIVTPFERAKVSTEASEGVEVRGGVIYVTPSGEGPVSMFITEDGDESVALNLTLVPSRVPPAHIELSLPEGVSRAGPARRAAREAGAEKFERGQAYVDMLRSLMRGLAFGRVPAGFEMAARVPAGVGVPACAASPVRVDFSRAQYLAGARVEVFVGVVVNPRPVGLEFIESWCGDPGVMAVALSPTPMVPPGGAAEIYIARRIAVSDEDAGQRRPVLVSGH